MEHSLTDARDLVLSLPPPGALDTTTPLPSTAAALRNYLLVPTLDVVAKHTHSHSCHSYNLSLPP